MGVFFNESTTAQIDVQVQLETIEHEEKIEKIVIVIVFILIFLFRGWIAFWLNFGIAIPSEFTYKSIDVKAEPVQVDYSPEVIKNKSFIYKSLLNKKQIEIMPQAHYEFSGIAASFNYDDFGGGKNVFDSSALYDLGATWGELGDTEVLKKYFEISSYKNGFTGYRSLNWTWKAGSSLTESYIYSHISLTHIIPANRNIMAALLKLKKYDKVKLEGELVNINDYGKTPSNANTFKTSLLRTDSGRGSSELMYVTKVQIGYSIYK